MKLLLVLSIFIALSAAFPTSYPKEFNKESNNYLSHSYATSDHSKSENRDIFGQYGLSYRTKDGVEVSERGYLKPGSDGQYYLAKEGTYKYYSPDGSIVNNKFTADENGYFVEKIQ